jgi:pyruvate formate lyase activating enzyme
MHRGLVFNIQKYSIQDGPGIRTTVFLKGCPLRCWWCHNPEGQSAEPEVVTVETRCTACGQCVRVCLHDGGAAPAASPQCIRCGACVDACPSEARQMLGQAMTVDEVLAEVLQDRVFYEESGGGVTFSGGEPLGQPDFLRELLRACHASGISTAVDTCGYAPWEQLAAVAPFTDLFLYDLKTIDDKRHVEYTGVSNKLILSNLKALGRIHANIWVRVPIVPGFNDDAAALEAIGRFAAAVPSVRQVNLLPYHETGANKFARLGRSYPAGEVPRLSPVQMAAAAETFRAAGMTNIHTGG